MGTLHLKFYSCLRLRFPDVETNPGPWRPVPASCRILCSNVLGLSGNLSDLVTLGNLSDLSGNLSARLSMIYCCALRPRLRFASRVRVAG